MEYSEEMVISLSVASVQFVAAIVITYILAREYNRCTFLTILWLSYDLITHVTLVSLVRTTYKVNGKFGFSVTFQLQCVVSLFMLHTKPLISVNFRNFAYTTFR